MLLLGVVRGRIELFVAIAAKLTLQFVRTLIGLSWNFIRRIMTILGDNTIGLILICLGVEKPTKYHLSLLTSHFHLYTVFFSIKKTII